jgi:hypothetical protein
MYFTEFSHRYKSKKDEDSEMLSWIKINTDLPEIHSRLIKDDEGDLQRVTRLSKYTVLDMRPGHRGQSKFICDNNSFGALLDVIFQIRCNLFHGQKSEMRAHFTLKCAPQKLRSCNILLSVFYGFTLLLYFARDRQDF